MTRPLRIPIASGTQGWDGSMDDDFTLILDAPFPIHEAVGLTESNVAATFPPGAYDRCFVWVNHSVYGYTLYWSDGVSWLPWDQIRRVTRSVTGATTFTSAEAASIILNGGSPAYTHVLPTASSMKGRTMTFKNIVAGTVTIDANGAETIDGAANTLMTTIYDTRRIYSNGTEWFLV